MNERSRIAERVSQKRCEDIAVGDDIWFLGKARRVYELEPYSGNGLAELGCFAIARGAEGWGIALYRGSNLEVLA